MSNANLRSSAKLSIINMASRVMGFMREVVKAYIFGTSAIGDAFQIAFTIPNLFRRLTAEGVMLNTFIPHFSRLAAKGDIQEAKNFFFSLFWTLLVFLSALWAAFVLNSEYLISNIFATGFVGETKQNAVYLSELMFIYIVFISIAALLQGVLNHHKKFVLAATTPILLNVCVISGGLIFFQFDRQPEVGLALGVILGGAIQAGMLIPATIKLGYKFWRGRFSWSPYLKNMVADTGPGIIGASIYQLNIVISNAIASHLAAGSVIALNFSNRLLELPLGVFVVSQTVVLLPYISEAFVKDDKSHIVETIKESFSILIFILLPVAVGMMVIAYDLIALLFGYGNFDQRSINLTAGILLFHAPGIIAIGFNRVLITVYQAAKLFKITMIFAFVSMVANISLALLLSPRIGAAGIALGSSVSQFVLTILLIIYLKVKTGIKVPWFEILKSSGLKHLIAVVIMGFLVFVSGKLEYGYLWTKVFIQIIVGVVSYGAICSFLKVEELKKIQSLFKRKKDD